MHSTIVVDDKSRILLTPALPTMALVESAVKYQATIKAPEDADEPSRACLMGLPVELRLHIYNFLLGDEMEPTIDSDYCYCYSVVAQHDIMYPLIRCTCASQTWPQILAANKQVFSEAMPVLYNNFEMRIALPDYWNHEHDKNYTPFRSLLNVIPHYGRIHICKIAVVGSSVVSTIRLRPESPPIPDLHWEHITDRLPNLRTIRFHFDIHAGVRLCDLERIDYEQLTRMASLPKVASVRLEVFRSYGCHTRIHDEVSASMSGKLEARIRATAKSLAKNVSVIDAGLAHGGDQGSQEEHE